MISQPIGARIAQVARGARIVRIAHIVRIARAAAVTLVVASVGSLPMLGACSSPIRHPVPHDQLSNATVPGMPNIRFWGDSADPVIEQAYLQSIRNERAAMGLAPGEDMPDSHFLALSGGGSNGAYGAGFLCGWTKHGDRPTFKVVTGISTGALIAPFAFLGPQYDDILKQVYTQVSTKQIAESRGILGGLTSDAMADNSPLRKLVEKYVTNEILEKVAAEASKGRILIIGTTHMDAQRPVVWSMGRIARIGGPAALKLFQDVLIASAAIPGAFPPVMIEVEADGKKYDEMHSDGGVCSQVFLYPAAFSFKEIDAAEGLKRTRHVYVIRNSQLAASYQAVPKKLLPITGRAIDTLIKTQGVGDLYRIYLGCQRDGLDYQLAFIPPDFTEESSEAFDPVYMTKLFDRGFADASSGYKWETAPPGFTPPGGAH